mgnify:CR=1 FL=1
MTADKALNQFFNSFGIPAFPETAVPDEQEMPYITYPFAFSRFDDLPVNLTVYLWYKTESEATPTAKGMEIINTIGRGGCTVEVDGGYIWLTTGSPALRPVQDEDNSIKRRALNITAEYFL